MFTGRRERSVRFDCEWPSALPGVPFSAAGRLWYRKTTDTSDERREATQAAAQLGLNELAAGICRKASPTDLDKTRHQLVRDLNNWTSAKESQAVEIRATIDLSLTPAAAKRHQEYEDERRAAQLESDRLGARLSGLRRVLGDPSLARAWWLDHHQDQLATFSWENFDTVVGPPLGGLDERQVATRQLAKVLGELMNSLGDNPGAHELFVKSTRIVLKELGLTSIAANLPPDEDSTPPTASGSPDGP